MLDAPPPQFVLGDVSGETAGFRHDRTRGNPFEDGFVKLEPRSRLCVSDYCGDSFLDLLESYDACLRESKETAGTYGLHNQVPSDYKMIQKDEN